LQKHLDVLFLCLLKLDINGVVYAITIPYLQAYKNRIYLILVEKYIEKLNLPGFIQCLDYWWHTACLLRQRCVSKAMTSKRKTTNSKPLDVFSLGI